MPNSASMGLKSRISRHQLPRLWQLSLSKLRSGQLKNIKLPGFCHGHPFGEPKIISFRFYSYLFFLLITGSNNHKFTEVPDFSYDWCYYSRRRPQE